MGFLDKLLGREKKAEEMPAEPQMRGEGTQPEPGGMTQPPPEPTAEGTEAERELP
jgi:hypothetical protein